MHTMVEIDGRGITDWATFHSTFKDVMGFFEGYGANMDAWIDCMTYIDDPNDGLSRVHAPEGGILVLSVSDASDFAERCPEIYDALIECSAFVNYRRLEVGHGPVIALSFYK